MNTEKINEYRNLLLDERAKLQAELESRGRLVSDSDEPEDWMAVPAEEDGARADDNENADDVEDFSTNIAVLSELEAQYIAVQDALKRIDSGKYGICEECGAEIEEERLHAIPSAKMCVAHMTRER